MTFHKGNLIHLSTRGKMNGYHIIFCRNLLIYLNAEALVTAISTLDYLLSHDGILFVGHAEPGIFSNSQFTPSSFPRTFSLIRRTTRSKQDTFHANSEHQGQREYETFGNDAAVPVAPKAAYQVDTLLEARLLSEKNQFNDAILLCQKHIEEHGPSANAFFWLGTILDENGKPKEAITMLRKAIYLNPEHMEAMKLLASLYSHTGDVKSFQSLTKRIQRVRARLIRNR